MLFFDSLKKLAQPKLTVAVSVSVSINTIFSSEYLFLFHNPLISDDYTLILFKDLKYFALRDMLIFSVSNIFLLFFFFSMNGSF